VLLVWVYYSAQIFFLGAEFTQVYANRYGGGIVPDESAERIIETGKEARGGAGVAHEPGEEQRREERAPERRAA
jgi:membrane protein